MNNFSFHQFKNIRKKYFALFIILTIGLFVLYKEVKFEGEKKSFLVGVGNDSASLLLQLVLEDDEQFILNDTNIKSYLIMDCCGSKSQWALSSRHLDLSVMCPDAAKELVEKDDNFVIITPIVMNSDVLIYKNKDSLNKIGYMQGRERQKNILQDTFSKDKSIIPVQYNAILYALEKNELDGGVVDIVQALKLDYKIQPLESSLPSYVLVGSKDFIETDDYKQFVKKYNSTIDGLNSHENIKRLLSFVYKEGVSTEEVKKWNTNPLKFLKID